MDIPLLRGGVHVDDVPGITFFGGMCYNVDTSNFCSRAGEPYRRKGMTMMEIAVSALKSLIETVKADNDEANDDNITIEFYDTDGSADLIVDIIVEGEFTDTYRYVDNERWEAQ